MIRPNRPRVFRRSSAARRELGRLRRRLDTLYEDRLDGRITKAFYDEKSRTTSTQIAEAERKLAATQSAELPPLTTALDIVRLTSNACHAFRAQPEPEQRELLTMTLKEAQWKDGRLHTTLLEPFELLRRSNQSIGNGINGKGESGASFAVWPPGMDSNHELDKTEVSQVIDSTKSVKPSKASKAGYKKCTKNSE